MRRGISGTTPDLNQFKKNSTIKWPHNIYIEFREWTDLALLLVVPFQIMRHYCEPFLTVIE